MQNEQFSDSSVSTFFPLYFSLSFVGWNHGQFDSDYTPENALAMFMHKKVTQSDHLNNVFFVCFNFLVHQVQRHFMM